MLKITVVSADELAFRIDKYSDDVKFTVWDKPPSGADVFLGQCTIPLNGLCLDGSSTKLPLKTRKNLPTSSTLSCRFDVSDGDGGGKISSPRPSTSRAKPSAKVSASSSSSSSAGGPTKSRTSPAERRAVGNGGESGSPGRRGKKEKEASSGLTTSAPVASTSKKSPGSDKRKKVGKLAVSEAVPGPSAGPSGSSSSLDDMIPATRVSGGGGGGGGDTSKYVTGAKVPSSKRKEVERRVEALLRESEGSGELDVCSLSLTHLPETVAKVASTLTTLNCGFNQMTQWPYLEEMGALESLWLDGNRIEVVPGTVGMHGKLRELNLNGNEVNALPPQFGRLTRLERLFINNNKLRRLCPEFGELRSLEELYAAGNPLTGLPTSIGGCSQLNVLELHGCKLRALPDEFTHLTRLMELNLATNQLTALPGEFGRLTRLISLDISDNRIPELPISMGLCNLSSIQLERNPLADEQLLEKYKIGSDHVMDYLRRRMEGSGFDAKSIFPDKQRRSQNPDEADDPAAARAQLAVAKGLIAHGDAPVSVDQKIALIKRDAQSQWQEIAARISLVKREVMTSQSVQDAIPLVKKVRGIKALLDPVLDMLHPFQKPAPAPQREGEPKLQTIKRTVGVALIELERILGSLQTTLSATSDPKMVVPLVKTIKSIRQALD